MAEQTYRLVVLITTPERDTISHVEDVVEATLQVQTDRRNWEVNVVACERLPGSIND